MKCYDKVEGWIGSVFEKLGYFIANHPWKIIIVVVLVNGLLGIGMMKLESEIDVSRVYTPMNSQAVKDEETLKGIFTDKSGTDFYSHQLIISGKSAEVIIKPNVGNIVDAAFLAECSRLDQLIRNVAGTMNGNSAKFSDICSRRSNSCVVEGDIFLSSEFLTAASNKTVTYPMFQMTQYDSLVADAEVQNGSLKSASHLMLKYFLRSDSEDFFQASETWEKEFVKVMEAFSSDLFDFSFAHTDSLSEELNGNIQGDITLFSVTFTLMITYACLATYSAKHNCVGNRVLLGFAGVLAACLSIVASFGLVSACGMKFVSIVGNLPFLVLGIGVDDMFILLSGIADALYDNDTRSRIGQMMRKSGVAITITSLTDILAFGAGASSTFKSVRNFCVFTGVAVFFCYINQLFFFSSCVTLNEKRVNSSRHFACCVKTKSKKEMTDAGSASSRIFCCAGEPPKSREGVEGLPEKGIRLYFSKFVLLGPVKVIVLILFPVYLGISIWGVTNLEQGLIVKDLVSEDSYYYKFQTWKDEVFPSQLPVTLAVVETYQYSNSQTQTNIENLIADSQANAFFRSDTILSWLQAYKSDPRFYSDSSENDFIAGLQLFFQEPEYHQYVNDVIIDGDRITAARFYIFTNVIEKSQDQGTMMTTIRDIASRSPLSVIAYSSAFIFYEQYIAILPQTLQTLGIGVAAVFLITALFMPHPILLFFVVITMAMIMTGIVAFMHFWDLTLSSVTMIHLIMSVGFSVDFTAHICHAFMVAKGSCRNERAAEAVTTSGGPIFNGAVSSVLGILMLAFAKSYIFRSFFKVMLLVIVFGASHALLFLPVVLSLIGPQTEDRSNITPVKEAHRENKFSNDSLHETSNFGMNHPKDSAEKDTRTSPTPVGLDGRMLRNSPAHDVNRMSQDAMVNGSPNKEIKIFRA